MQRFCNCHDSDKSCVSLMKSELCNTQISTKVVVLMDLHLSCTHIVTTLLTTQFSPFSVMSFGDIVAYRHAYAMLPESGKDSTCDPTLRERNTAQPPFPVYWTRPCVVIPIITI